MNTHNYRPGFVERMKRRLRDGLRWLAWKTAKYLSVMALGVALYENSDKIGEVAKDKLSSIFNSGAQVSAAQEPVVEETVIQDPIAQAPIVQEAITPPPPTAQAPITRETAPTVKTLPPAPEDLKKYRDGPLWKDGTPAPTPPPVKKELPPPPKAPPSPKAHAPKQGRSIFAVPVPLAKLFGKMTPQQEWTKDQMVAEITRLAQGDRITKDLMMCITQSESEFKVNADSGPALGPAQFVWPTQLEYMYRFKNLLPSPYNIMAEDIETYGSPHVAYRVRHGGDERAIRDAIKNPQVAFTLQREYLRDSITEGKRVLRETLRHQIAHLKKEETVLKAQHHYKPAKKLEERIAVMQFHLTRPMTYTDAKTFYVLGPSGGAAFLAAYADPGKIHHKATLYLKPSAVSSNPKVVYLDEFHKISRDVNGLHAYFQSKVGRDALKTLPENLERPGETRLAQTPHDEHHLS